MPNAENHRYHLALVTEPHLVDPDVLERVLASALAHGGDFAEVFVEDRRMTAMSLDDRRVEELSSGHDRGAGVRVMDGESTGYAHTADLTERGLCAAAEAASAVARQGGAGTRPREVNLDRSAAAPTQPSVVRTPPSSVSKATKVELLRRADDLARSKSDSVVQVTAGYADSRRRIQVANSEGLLTGDDRVRTRFSVMCVTSGDAGMQTGYESEALTVGFELFDRPTVEHVASEAVRRAIAKLKARPAPSGVVPVVLQSGSGGILFHEACGHGLEADHIVKNSSVYAGRLGDQVASPLVTLVDDGTMGPNWGSYAIDDEGRPARRNVLIDCGTLVDYMWDGLSGKRGNHTSSGNGRRESFRHLPMVRMTNTYLLPGEDDPEEIVAQTPRGVYVARLGGGQVNTATGDFVFGMTEAYLIENGRITEPLRDANLIGNGPDVLSRINAVGSDLQMAPGTCGKDGQAVPVGCGQPTLRITGVTIGGTAGA
jgi:TldD protein